MSVVFHQAGTRNDIGRGTPYAPVSRFFFVESATEVERDAISKLLSEIDEGHDPGDVFVKTIPLTRKRWERCVKKNPLQLEFYEIGPSVVRLAPKMLERKWFDQWQCFACGEEDLDDESESIS